MTLIATFLVLASIIGWASFLRKAVNVSLTEGIFTVMAASGCFMLIAFILKIPTFSASFFLYGGLLILPYHLFIIERTGGLKSIFKQSLPLITLILIVIVVISLMAWGLQFSSIDDYSYWGTISRFLFVFNHLPENASLIKASFLQYTPGLACFHYLFYQIAGFYSPMLNYIAQDLILLAPLLLFIDKDDPWRSLASVMIIIITLYLAYGNILAKLEVDATVALWFFSMLWMAIRQKPVSIWTLVVGLTFLSIIKEIGLLFSLVVIGVHYASHHTRSAQFRRAILLLISVLCMKLFWLIHVNQYGFASFATRITTSKALTSLVPGYPNYVKSQQLFLKGLLSYNFDHIFKIPFVAIFLLCGWQIHRLSRLARLQKHHIILFKSFLLLLPFYLINLYWLQAIVFRVGYQQTHLLDFPRYFNMAFVPFVLSVLLISLQTKQILYPEKLKKWAAVLSSVALVFVVGGKIERTRKFYQPFEFTRLAEAIQAQSEQVDRSKPICLSHLPEPDYQVLLPLQYQLMPRQIIHLGAQKSVECGQIINFAAINR